MSDNTGFGHLTGQPGTGYSRRLHAPSEECDCRPYLHPYHCAVSHSRGLSTALDRIDSLEDALREILAARQARGLVVTGDRDTDDALEATRIETAIETALALLPANKRGAMAEGHPRSVVVPT